MTRKNNYFKTFCNLSKAFGTTVKKEELLDLIVDSAIETMGGKAACLFLADEQRQFHCGVRRGGKRQNFRLRRCFRCGQRGSVAGGKTVGQRTLYQRGRTVTV